MIIKRAYKTQIYPNAEQMNMLLRCCGASRFVYNWGLSLRTRAYKRFGISLSDKTLDKHLRKIKNSHPDFAWLNEIPSHVRQGALANLQAAFTNFFRRVKNGDPSPGYPAFKSRSRGIGSATFFGYKIEDACIRLPNIGRVRLSERGYMPLGENGRNDGYHLYGVRVTERAGRWFASVQAEISIPDADASDKPVIGVDAGIKSMAVVSDERIFENPRAEQKYRRALRRASRALSRTQVGGKNRIKAKARVAKLHAKISYLRADATHKATADIATSASIIVVEDLNVAGMMKNRRLARAVADANMGELRRQLEYKAAWNGATIKKASRWMPSSKTCSGCGHTKSVLSLGERVYKCESCGLEIDRDLNAARNLAKLVQGA